MRQARETLRLQATHDPMTGLPNRAGFGEGLDRVLAHPPRAGRRLAVLFLDMDDFKAVNDEYGHAAGDRVLVTCARRIRSLLRADDLLARFGGDEFVALLTGIRGPVRCRLVAEQVHTVVRAPIPLDDGREVYVSLSIGVAMVDPRTRRRTRSVERTGACTGRRRPAVAARWSPSTDRLSPCTRQVWADGARVVPHQPRGGAGGPGRSPWTHVR